jgi:TRAP-type transport system small permease protein
VINYSSTSAVMEVSMAWFFASGVIFSASGGLIVLWHFWQLVTGQLADAQLVGIQESEETPHADSSAQR